MTIRSDDDLTIGPDAGTRAPSSAGAFNTPVSSRFLTGAVIAGRYRLVALLGKGGMGEVYRADDLTLDHPVALKFLPEGVAAGGDRLASFHNELRIARQVSHKNVCRLYDLGEADGRRFLTMEYVDGEDLASLLRRIGHIPQDKAIVIARQLCAGVAAAHERGVLHRDLKPANVMIDGDGNVRVTDFGLAIAAGDDTASHAGTPQYMAPEQLAGQPASIRTDVYALGLVLFEIFTGRRAFEAKTLNDLRDLHQSGTVTIPSSVVRDLDPAVERAILRCLEKDPQRRPASALAVSAALPGGDPLAAALAAGETPSPEMLVAAGETEALGVGTGLALLAWVAIGMIVLASLSAHTSVIGRVPLEKPPAVLIDRAEQIIASLGYTDRPGDHASGLQVAGDYTEWILQSDRSAHRYDTLSKSRPPAILFWYRTSPRPMVALLPFSVKPGDPPVTDTDMRTIVLDTNGRLQQFRSVPVQFDPDATPAPPPRWEALFAAADLPISAFSSVPPQWTPRDFSDTRAAWEGPLPERPEYRVRVEAAAYRGLPVSFTIVGPWTRPTRQTASRVSGIDSTIQAIFIVFVILLAIGAVVLARRNLRLRRADTRSATIVAAAVFIAYGIDWVVSAHHVSDISLEYTNLLRTISIVTFNGVFLWMVYLALEPYVRKFWPDSLLGWTRLLSGYLRDPRVGRDVLAGVAFGVAVHLTDVGKTVIVPALGFTAPFPAYGMELQTLLGPGWIIGAWLERIGSALIVSMTVVLIFVVLRLVLRRSWLSVTTGLILMAVSQMHYMDGTGFYLAMLFPIAAGALMTLVVVRVGLLTLAVTIFVANVVSGIPLTLNVSHWSATASDWSLAGLMALACFAFYSSRGGQPLFGKIGDMANG